jgi:hypothetical protein
MSLLKFNVFLQCLLVMFKAKSLMTLYAGRRGGDERMATKTQLKDDNRILTNFGTTYPYLYDPGSIYRDTI